MTDKNLTDSEIVKDLNEAEDLENVLLYCKNPNKEVMIPIKIADIRDLINRLQAENERLKNAYKQVAWERDIFAEDMKQEIKKDCSYLMSDIKTIKAEAYKEFANELLTLSNSYEETKGVFKMMILKILKEKVGDSNAKEKK